MMLHQLTTTYVEEDIQFIRYYDRKRNEHGACKIRKLLETHFRGWTAKELHDLVKEVVADYDSLTKSDQAVTNNNRHKRGSVILAKRTRGKLYVVIVDAEYYALGKIRVATAYDVNNEGLKKKRFGISNRI